MRPQDAPERLERRDLLKAAVGASLAGLAAAPAGLAAGSGAPALEPGGEGPVSKGRRIIDIHNHPCWLGKDADAIVADMDRSGIERTWLLSWELPEHEMSPSYYRTLNPLGHGIPFRDVVHCRERHPGRFIAGYAPDPRDPHARARLRSAVEIHRVRVFGELKVRALYDDPDLIAIFHDCAELGLPVVFHLDVTLPRGAPQNGRQYWYGGHIDNVERALKQCPGTQFIGHAPGFWREISGDAESEPSAYPAGKPVKPGGRLIRLLERYPNLHCDLSAGSGYTALTRDLEFTRRFLIEHQDRCLFGRDQFDDRLHDLLMSLSLPEEALAKILAGNALRLVPIS